MMGDGKDRMLSELLHLLPREGGSAGVYAAAAGAIAGVILWLFGSFLSRWLITLLLVAVGAFVGKHVPLWFGWGIDPMATSVGGAVLAGLGGYTLHRAWIGVGLGLILAFWACLATLLVTGALADWSWAAIHPDTVWWRLPAEMWGLLDEETTRILPYAAAGAFVSGVIPTILWPQVTACLLYSMAGLSMALGMGAAAIQLGGHVWVPPIPQSTWIQLSIMAGLLALGVLIQWRLMPLAESPPPVPAGHPDDD